jgi:exodeoxyribonuclease VII small subunit
MAKERFEDALNKLEKIVSKLEERDIPLEESLKLFEEGIRLSRLCHQKLDEAEKKVEILLKGKEGILELQPFEPSGQGERSSTGVAEIPSINSGQARSMNSEQALADEEE